MSRNIKTGLMAWILGLILANVLLFCLSREQTQTVWLTFGFVCMAFLSTLVFQLIVWKRISNSDEQVLYIPALSISYVYIVIQIPLCVVFALGSVVILWKVALLIHSVVLVLAWFAVIGSLTGNEHVRKVNDRQKNHHIEL